MCVYIDVYISGRPRPTAMISGKKRISPPCLKKTTHHLSLITGLRGTFFYVRRVVDLMKTAKVNAYIMYIFGKNELLSIHVT